MTTPLPDSGQSLDQSVISLLRAAAEAYLRSVNAPEEAFAVAQSPELQVPRNPDHGDWAANIAMKLAKPLKAKPLAIAEGICAALQTGDLLEKPDPVAPGFINLRVGAGAIRRTLERVIAEKDSFGQSGAFAGQRALVEFVSANPTGPLHVGHGRNAVVGDTAARIYAAAGFQVEREYYFNDAGVQMRNLGLSVQARYLEACGRPSAFPEDGYHGDYIREIAEELRKEFGDAKADETDIDFFSQFGARWVTKLIHAVLARLGIVFDRHFSETTLHRDGRVDAAIAKLRELDQAYEKDGALWLRSKNFGDDEDRVIIKKDGNKTYLAPDIAYHQDKFGRGYDRLVNVLGADHHSYVIRLKAAVAALGYDPARLHCILIQMVNVLEGGEIRKFSKRAGNFITLDEIVEELSPDLVRFFFLLRSADSQMTFDLDLAKQRSMDNPYWYIQYAHARCCSLFAKAAERGIAVGEGSADGAALLKAPEERAIVFQMGRLPSVIAEAARQDEHLLVMNFLRDLATAFHAYFTAGNKDASLRCIDPERPDVTAARLSLIAALRQTLANGLRVLGISPIDRLETREAPITS